MDGLLLPLLLILVVAIPLVLGSRKQKKQQQQQQELQRSLVIGDRVMTTSGLYATVADATDETTIDLEIAEGVVTTWLRQAVREKVHGEDLKVEADSPVESKDEDDTAESADVTSTEEDSNIEEAEKQKK